MNRAFLILCVALIVVSFVLSSSSEARQSRQEDYCAKDAGVCFDQCTQYNYSFWGISWPSPRTTACVGECTVAYVGCIMMRFRLGV